MNKEIPVAAGVSVSVEQQAIFLAQWNTLTDDDDVILLHPEHVESIVAALLAAKLKAESQGDIKADYFEKKSVPGKRWFCMACGKKSTTESELQDGWTENCHLTCILIDKDARGPTVEQIQAYEAKQKRAIDGTFSRLNRLLSVHESAGMPFLDLAR